MGLILQNLAGFSWGHVNDETGINLDRMTVGGRTKWIDVPDKQGQDRGFVSYNPTQDISIEGESIGTNGLMAATIGAALTLANIFNVFGISNTGNTYTQEGTLEMSREALQKLTIRAKRYNAF